MNEYLFRVTLCLYRDGKPVPKQAAELFVEAGCRSAAYSEAVRGVIEKADEARLDFNAVLIDALRIGEDR